MFSVVTSRWGIISFATSPCLCIHGHGPIRASEGRSGESHLSDLRETEHGDGNWGRAASPLRHAAGTRRRQRSAWSTYALSSSWASRLRAGSWSGAACSAGG